MAQTVFKHLITHLPTRRDMLLTAVPPCAQVEQEHLTSRNILLERLRAVRETEAAETQAQTSASGDMGAPQASDASTGTAVCTAPQPPRSLRLV